MQKNRLLITAGLIGTLLAAPSFAAQDKEKSEADWGRYKENLQQRHQMNMDMMQTMVDTMTILRDMNHQPSAEERKKLDDMIKKMNDMMARQKEMNDKAMKYMEEHRGKPMDGRDKR